MTVKPGLRHLALLGALCLTLTVGALLPAQAAKKTTLLVHAGAGIRPALDEAGQTFERKTGIRVDYNYKGSGCLLPDVVMSEEGDVYIPGEVYYMKQAVDRKLVNPKYQIVATMSTMLIVPADNPKKIRTVQDLAKPGVQLGLGDVKAVAIGKAAKEVLTKAGVWSQAQKNLAMTAQNVTELSNAVKLGQLDAAIVWNATCALYTKREITTLAIPAKYCVTVPVPAGVVKFSEHSREAQRYVDFLASPAGKAIFAKHGFGADNREEVAWWLPRRPPRSGVTGTTRCSPACCRGCSSSSCSPCCCSCWPTSGSSCSTRRARAAGPSSCARCAIRRSTSPSASA
jgi:molybdate transport system substrate-binding protein